MTTTAYSDASTTTVALVGCGSAKQDETVPAKELYTSNYFGLKREFAETFADEQFVLSAEHALVPFDQELAPYDTTVGDDGFDAGAFVDDIASDLVTYELEDVDEILVLAGKKYVAHLETALEETDAELDDVEIRYPFDEADCSGIGEQMGFIRSTVDEHLEALEQEESADEIDAEADDESDDDVLVTDGGSENTAHSHRVDSSFATSMQSTLEGELFYPNTGCELVRGWSGPCRNDADHVLEVKWHAPASGPPKIRVCRSCRNRAEKLGTVSILDSRPFSELDDADILGEGSERGQP